MSAFGQGRYALITVTAFAQSRGLDLMVNGRPLHVPQGTTEPVPVHEDFVDAIANSGAAYTIHGYRTIEAGGDPMAGDFDLAVNGTDTDKLVVGSARRVDGTSGNEATTANTPAVPISGMAGEAGKTPNTAEAGGGPAPGGTASPDPSDNPGSDLEAQKALDKLGGAADATAALRDGDGEGDAMTTKEGETLTEEQVANLDGMADLSVPHLTERLDAMSLAELRELHNREQSKEDGGRVTALSAIHSAIEAKSQDA